MKVCNNCNSEYNPTSNRQLFCTNCKNESMKRCNKRKYEKNKDKYNLKVKEYNNKNMEWYKEYHRNYHLIRKNNDPLYKLTITIRTRISNDIRSGGYKKNSKSESILGCSYEFFKEYIELQFKTGMSWENQGKWHLDHIKPISLANTKEEIYELNKYKNFQPMWALENIKKSNNYEGHEIK